VSHATPDAVQYMPCVLPVDPLWQRGSAGSVHSPLLAHVFVHAANRPGPSAQLKQVVPPAHGPPQSLTNVVQRPATQATPAVSSNRSREPSSAYGCCAAHPHAGYAASHWV
jgi:hypothetical protein